MKLFNVIIFLLIKISIANAQEEKKVLRYLMKKDSSYLFIDNGKSNWYTIDLESDTIIDLGNSIYYYNNKTIQINSVGINNGKEIGVMDSPEEEIGALKWHQKWEEDYQQKNFRKKLKVKEELFYNKNQKPFLIWYYEKPNKIKKSSETRVIEYEKSNGKSKEGQSYNEDSILIESYNVTHQIFLDFMVHGKTCVSISTSLLENEDLAKEIANLKKIANSLVVYGLDIDLDILSKRSKSKGTFVYKDSLENISLEIPDDINVFKGQYFTKDVLSLSFPEKNNIVNATCIMWVDKAKAGTFEQFINKGQKVKRKLSDLNELPKGGNLARYSINSNDSFFAIQTVYIEGVKNYYYISFTATLNTYDFNIGRFQELLSKIKLK